MHMNPELLILFNIARSRGYVDSTDEFFRKLDRYCKSYSRNLTGIEIMRLKLFENIDHIFRSDVENDASAQKVPEDEKDTNTKKRKGECDMATKWDEVINAFYYPEQYVNEKGEQINPFKQLKLIDTAAITVPGKMDLFRGLDITEKDRLFVSFAKMQYYTNVLFINGEDHIVGVFRLKHVRIDDIIRYVLIADAEDLDFKEHMSTKYFFVFCDISMKTYKVPIEASFQDTKTASTHLCIDFGTSNTTVGCFLDEHYVDNISNIAVINGNVVLNSENVATFMDADQRTSTEKIDTLNFRRLVPTIVYVDDCSNPKDIIYSFGYEASRKIKEDNYCPKASCFMEIKRWTSNIDLIEDIQDANGNKAAVSRKEIISQYLMFIISSLQLFLKNKIQTQSLVV